MVHFVHFLAFNFVKMGRSKNCSQVLILHCRSKLKKLLIRNVVEFVVMEIMLLSDNEFGKCEYKLYKKIWIIWGWLNFAIAGRQG